ncbi:MAG: hypothetical protein JST50_06925 [Bacteroidetes bacterium]|jgi:formate hydrogenlyase subunit 3/multisubunit Na+/H+ antiporter MnhD subunit|nr:hypothetical protein [Bacteroidota bacterium]
MIFFQDIKSRSVYWILFPALTGLLLGLRYFQNSGSILNWQSALFNVGFLIVQLLLVTFYFSIKNRKLTNITNELLGLGDVLFILSIAFYLPIFNYLFFYIVSLITVLASWICWQSITSNNNKHIPLAGLQAALFAGFLLSDWILKTHSLTDDTWILNLITR